METSVLLLTILCGIFIAWVVTNHERNKPLPRRVFTVPTTAAPRKPFVVRVSGIPSSDTSQAEACIKTTIATFSNDGSDCVSDINIVPSCTDTDNLVAIVDFKMLPDFLFSLKEGSPRSCQVPGRDRYLHFDAEFFGFTQMYSPEAKPTAE